MAEEEKKKIDFDSLDFNEIANSGKTGVQKKDLDNFQSFDDFDSEENTSLAPARSLKDNILLLFVTAFCLLLIAFATSNHYYYYYDFDSRFHTILYNVSTCLLPVLILVRATNIIRLPYKLHLILCFVCTVILFIVCRYMFDVRYYGTIAIWLAVVAGLYFIAAFLSAFGFDNLIIKWAKRALLLAAFLMALFGTNSVFFWLPAAALLYSFMDNDNN